MFMADPSLLCVVYLLTAAASFKLPGYMESGAAAKLFKAPIFRIPFREYQVLPAIATFGCQFM